MLFLLKIVWRRDDFGKCLSISCKNFCATFVFTFLHAVSSKSVMPTTRNHLTTLVTHLKPSSQNMCGNLKNKERDFSIKWSILKRVSPRTAGRSKCNLCLEEKLCILESDSALTLNKRSELFSKCRHRYMFSARNFKRSRNSKDR